MTTCVLFFFSCCCCCCSHYFRVLYSLLRPPAAQERQGALLVLTSPFSHIDQPLPDPISLWTGAAIKSHVSLLYTGPPPLPPLHPVHPAAHSLPAPLASAPASVCVQPSRLTHVHHGDKGEERGRLCVICAVATTTTLLLLLLHPLHRRPSPLGRGGEPRRGLFGPGERRARHRCSQWEQRRDERRDSLQRPWLSPALDSLVGTAAFNRPLICTVQKA